MNKISAQFKDKKPLVTYISGGDPSLEMTEKLIYRLQDDDGQVIPAYSISAGLDYPGVGPEHSYLKSIERVDYQSATDLEAVAAFKLLSEKEGIIPALESSHALSYLEKLAPKLEEDQIIVVNLSGRGDKDINNFKKIREAEKDE